MPRTPRPAALLPLALLAAAGPAPPPAEWTGTWAMELRVASAARVPVLGWERSVSRSLLLVRVEREGAEIVHRPEPCAVSIEGARVRVTVPEAFVRSLPARRYVARPTADPERFTADMGMEHVGYDPALTGGALPADARSPAVRDTDGDGAPGATVVTHVPVAGSVRVYVAQRSHLVLHGRRTAPDRLEGTVEIRALEQRTLGATNAFFRRTLRIRPEPEGSRFAMVRTGARSCAELRARADALFPPDQEG